MSLVVDTGLKIERIVAIIIQGKKEFYGGKVFVCSLMQSEFVLMKYIYHFSLARVFSFLI